MIVFAIILGVVIVAAAMFSYIQKLNQKQTVPDTVAAPAKTFSVTINYVTSFIKTYEKHTYVFINMTIFNKMDKDMDNVTIETEPALPIINDLNYRATTENWKVDRLDPVHADTIQARVLNIPPGTTVSGYLIVESPKAQCNVETIKVTNNEIIQTVEVRKEKVLMKTGNIRRF